MGKELTLEQLAASGASKVEIKPSSDAIKTAKPVSISELTKNLPGKEEDKQEGEKPPVIVENAFNAMTERLEKSKKFIEEEVIPRAQENAREMVMERELGEAPREEEVEQEEELNIDEDNKVEEEVSYEAPVDTDIELDDTEPEPKKVEQPKQTPVFDNSQDVSGDISDLDELIGELNKSGEEFTVNETDTEESIEEARERFKESLDDIKVTKNNINLSEYTINKNPVSSSVILNTINTNKTACQADWVLYATGRPVRMQEGSGTELDILRKTIDNSNNLNGIIASLRFVYDHIVDGNKPSFEVWCKTTRTEDLDSLYFAYYKACYGSINLVGRSCLDPKKNRKHEGCNKTSIIDTPIDDMVKFENDEVKNKFYEILQRDTTSSGNNTIKSHMIIASDNIAISYSDPTLYNTFIQFNGLPQNIVDKYSDLLTSLAYINGFYAIDQVNKQLQPINIKVYPNNLNKTILSKLKVYIEILKTLTNDQYSVLISKLNNLIEDPKVTYIYPKTICPECGTEIPEEEIPSVLSLLFTRAQLAQVKSL